MATVRTFIDTNEVYRQIGEMLGVDLSKCRKAVIHLEAGAPVMVDLMGIPAERVCKHQCINTDRNGVRTCYDCGATL